MNDHRDNRDVGKSCELPSDDNSCDMDIGIEPPKLSFEYPSKEHCKADLVIINKNIYCIAFKIKTTTPRQYCVRPTMGILPPNSTYTVSISLAVPPETLTSPSSKWKDKFLIVCSRYDGSEDQLSKADLGDLAHKFWSKVENSAGVDGTNQKRFERRIRSEISLRMDALEIRSKKRISRTPPDHSTSYPARESGGINYATGDVVNHSNDKESLQSSRSPQDDPKPSARLSSDQGGAFRPRTLLQSEFGSSKDLSGANNSQYNDANRVDSEQPDYYTLRERSTYADKPTLHPSKKIPRTTKSSQTLLKDLNLSSLHNHLPSQDRKVSPADLLYPPLVYWVLGLSTLFFIIGTSISK